MNPTTQLLCTFSTVETLEDSLRQIIDNYSIAFDTIYVLENTDTANALCVTYNIDMTAPVGENIPTATISLHRKKATNTLYTINALNMLVSELNGGKMDRTFQVPWNSYKNTILVTAYNKLKIIHTKLHKIIRLEDIE